MRRLEDMDRKCIEELMSNDEGRLARMSWHELVVFGPDNLDFGGMLADTFPS